MLRGKQIVEAFRTIRFIVTREFNRLKLVKLENFSTLLNFWTHHKCINQMFSFEQSFPTFLIIKRIKLCLFAQNSTETFENHTIDKRSCYWMLFLFFVFIQKGIILPKIATVVVAAAAGLHNSRIEEAKVIQRRGRGESKFYICQLFGMFFLVRAMPK